jgi:hypothetical protein
MTRHRWTLADDRLIEDLVGEHRTDYIARRLGLSVGQVNNRIAALGLSRRREGVYSANALQAVLGIEGNWIRSFLLGTGVLRSRRRGVGRWGQTEIREHDLVAFLRAYPHLIDRDRVDAAYQQFVDDRWITTVEAFRRGAPHPVELEHAFHAGTVPEVRKRGMRWVIPESLLPRLVEGRRRWTDDAEHRRQVRMYERLQARGVLRAMVKAQPRRRRTSAA